MQKILGTLLLTGIWFVLFFFVNFRISLNKISKRKEDDIKNRLISMIHGVLAFWLAFITLLVRP
jgi:uncharacterized BrkB/YihY/UPF0761 family membrane protein